MSETASKLTERMALPAVFPTKPAEKTDPSSPKFNFKVAFIVLIITGLIVVYFLPKGKSREEYFQELQNRKEAGDYLTSGEKTDFCELLFLLRDSVSTECVSILDGINWDNPPKSPEFLSEDWEELPTGDSKRSRKFKHKKYGIEFVFDTADETAGKKAAKSRGHYHRFNPNSKNKTDYYLDENGLPCSKGSKSSHIYTRK